MAALLFLCGAVPVTDLQQFDGPLITEERLVFCCCCHHVQPFTPQIAQAQQTEQQLPDVIPSFTGERIVTKSKSSPIEEEVETSDETDNKLSSREWRQIGHDLRLIADRFQLERRTESTLNVQHWLWRTVVQTAAIYIGYRLHRWATSV